MNIPERLQALVRELGQKMGLDEFQLDFNGGCALRLDQRMTISLQYREPEAELWLYADLGQVPERSSSFYERLLQANLFWQQTSGATLSLSGDNPPHAVLARPLQWVHMNATHFGAAVETFVNGVEEWQERLSNAHQTPNTQVATAPDADVNELLLRSRA